MREWSIVKACLLPQIAAKDGRHGPSRTVGLAAVADDYYIIWPASVSHSSGAQMLQGLRQSWEFFRPEFLER